MSGQSSNETMLELYFFETSQYIEQLENIILTSEKDQFYNEESINEIFRIMHTIKGSSAMMLFNNISSLSHSIEDLFYFLREQKPGNIDTSSLSDIVFEAVDFIKVELQKIKDGNSVDGDSTFQVEKIKSYLLKVKEDNPSSQEVVKPPSSKKERFYIPPVNATGNNCYTYKAIVSFIDGCEMENVRAYSVINNLMEYSKEVCYTPYDILENEESLKIIRENGITIYIKTDMTFEKINEILMETILLKDLKISLLESDEEFLRIMSPTKKQEEDIKLPDIKADLNTNNPKEATSSTGQSIISVNVTKLDSLMDLVGEMVIAEAMVIQNPDLAGLNLDNFQKAAVHLHKITSELQNMVMSIRMVPLLNTFQKMQRIVRDMSKKLNKEVRLELIGAETEVDKKIIEHISDPIMHLIRNSIDHGIESPEERIQTGKSRYGTITLEARNEGSDVLVIVKDDGKGLDREKILKRARENNLLTKEECELTNKDIYSLILKPGFSTKESISEYSGRGVGMDVVTNNLEVIGGVVSVESESGFGTVITLKIPLTLAIIDGMNISVGRSKYTIPIIAIKESFKANVKDFFNDPDGNEFIMVRGECFPIIRLHKYFDVDTQIVELTEGIIIMVEYEEKTICIFADELIGQQQVVVKTLPTYIRTKGNIKGLSGCTLLGDGSISLIIDICGLIKNK